MTLKIELQNNYLWSYVDTRPISMILYNKKKPAPNSAYHPHKRKSPKNNNSNTEKKSHHNDV